MTLFKIRSRSKEMQLQWDWIEHSCHRTTKEQKNLTIFIKNFKNSKIASFLCLKPFQDLYLQQLRDYYSCARSASRLLLQMFQCSSRLNLKSPKMWSTCLPQKSSSQLEKYLKGTVLSILFSLRMPDSLCLFVQQLLHLQMFPSSRSKVLHAKYNRVLFSRRIKHPLLATVTNPPL